jgi:acyl-CoA synthetase (AMP-forming)/AMP-acid ligase II
MLLEMAAEGLGDRVALGAAEGGLSYNDLLDRSRRAATWLSERPGENVGLIDMNSPAVPIALYASAVVGRPFAPLNYRLPDDQLRAILTRIAPATVIVDESFLPRVDGVEGIELVTREQFLDEVAATEADLDPDLFVDPDSIAILLFTSGTSGEPKAAILRHSNLVSYVLGTVEFMAAGDDECALVSVPPYHIAGMSALVTGFYGGRRIYQLPQFEDEAWVEAAATEQVTHAMVVPTMLQRILDILEARGEKLPSLRHLSYGGGVMPLPVIERALEWLPQVNFVNAYGLTETSSTVALLTPDDHRVALASDDPEVRKRLNSVGRPLPTVEVEIRDPEGSPLGVGERGEVWLRGEQVSGEYVGKKVIQDDGWFPTNDAGWIDVEGYLFVGGRLDDIIIRGGENMSPGEIEDALLAHPAVSEAGVCGVPDVQWGEKVVAAVVLKPGHAVDESTLQEWVRSRLRSSRMPSRVDFRAELPYTDTGKLLRRVLKAELSDPEG